MVVDIKNSQEDTKTEFIAQEMVGKRIFVLYLWILGHSSRIMGVPIKKLSRLSKQLFLRSLRKIVVLQKKMHLRYQRNSRKAARSFFPY
jgi:hypothetical protein